MLLHQIVQCRPADSQHLGGLHDVAARLVDGFGQQILLNQRLGVLQIAVFQGIGKQAWHGLFCRSGRRLEAEIARFDGLRIAHYHGPLDLVLQFAHVAGPVVIQQLVDGRRAEAADALRRDWLFQTAGQPLLERARAEVGWARALAARLGQDASSPELTELSRLEQRILDSAANRPAEAPEPPTS